MAESCLFFVGNFPTTTKNSTIFYQNIERKEDGKKKEKEIFFAEKKNPTHFYLCTITVYKLLCVTTTHQPPWRELQTRKPDIIHSSGGNDRKSNSLTLTEIIILCYYSGRVCSMERVVQLGSVQINFPTLEKEYLSLILTTQTRSLASFTAAATTIEKVTVSL